METNTTSTTPDGDSRVRTFKIVHPFHPLCGQVIKLVTIKINWGDEQVFYRRDNGTLTSVPVSWTDIYETDPFLISSAGRAAFRLCDLLELERLIDTLRQEQENEK